MYLLQKYMMRVSLAVSRGEALTKSEQEHVSKADCDKVKDTIIERKSAVVVRPTLGVWIAELRTSWGCGEIEADKMIRERKLSTRNREEDNVLLSHTWPSSGGGGTNIVDRREVCLCAKVYNLY